jgi:sulfoxide reductase heme-binding subunit YedZ
MRYLKSNWLKIVTHIGALLPLAWLIFDYWQGRLSFNPIQDITLRTGNYGLKLLVLSLAVTPVITVTGWRQLQPLRKWLGLYGFMYIVVHFYAFVWLDYRLNVTLLQEAIFEKRYALVGFAALVMLTPLAITSTKGWMRRLGKNWRRLHRLAYASVLLGVIHFVWLVKSDIREPLLYGGIVILLLALRLPAVRKPIINWRNRRKLARRTVSAA